MAQYDNEQWEERDNGVRACSIEDSAGARHWVYSSKPATPKAVNAVLLSSVGDDGRSEWKWFRLGNGDLVLGVYPTGEVYSDHESEASF